MAPSFRTLWSPRKTERGQGAGGPKVRDLWQLFPAPRGHPDIRKMLRQLPKPQPQGVTRRSLLRPWAVMRVEPVSHSLLRSYSQWGCGVGAVNMPRAPTSILRHNLSLPRAQDCRPWEERGGAGARCDRPATQLTPASGGRPPRVSPPVAALPSLHSNLWVHMNGRNEGASGVQPLGAMQSGQGPRGPVPSTPRQSVSTLERSRAYPGQCSGPACCGLKSPCLWPQPWCSPRQALPALPTAPVQPPHCSWDSCYTPRKMQLPSLPRLLFKPARSRDFSGDPVASIPGFHC